jgi:hypothetical protein
MGGPALQADMYPKVYALCEHLDDISVPIISMGIGWHAARGRWEDTHHYPLSHKTKSLLEKIEHSGYISSVRDYHTLNVLSTTYQYKNFIMTGCPALYSADYLHHPRTTENVIKKIGFSLGVSLKKSHSMFAQMQAAVLALREAFLGAELVVAFHHKLEKQASPSNAQMRFAKWLASVKINYTDISGSAQALTTFYESCDLHVGYRVHAHIFMSSISRPSVLLCEDGRGTALRDVIGGVCLDAFTEYMARPKGFWSTLIKRKIDPFTAYAYLSDDLIEIIRYELTRGVKWSQVRHNIDLHFSQMQAFIKQLP